jgi:hypothetical protein
MEVRFLICPECAYSTSDGTETLCKWCRTELLGQCTICSKPIDEARTIYCKLCGTKLRISYVPIQ